MGFIDGLRRAFRSQCDHLIKYQAGVFSFNGFGADVPSVNVSVAGLRTGIVKLEHATEVAKNLDNYQFLMCKLCHELSRSSNLLEKIVRARAVALGGLTSFSNTLAAFNADPKGQRSNLSRAVKEMQNIMRQINNDIFKSEAAQIGKITGKVREEIHDLKWSEVIKGREAPRMKRLPAMTRPPSSTPQQKTPKTWNDAIKFAGLEETELDKLTKEVLTDIRS